MNRVGALLALGALTFGGAACASTGSTSVKGDGGQEVSESRAAAAGVCEKFVGQRLKAPGGASYRDPFGDQIRYEGDGDGPITVTASVDSENGFGAKLRSPYVCTVTKAGGDNWRLDNLNLQDGGDTGG